MRAAVAQWLADKKTIRQRDMRAARVYALKADRKVAHDDVLRKLSGTDDATAWIAHCRAGWYSGGIQAFAMFEADSGHLLGGIGLNQHNPPHRSANLGYWVRQSHQGKGLAAAAAALVARFGFEQLGLVRIEIVTLPGNRASQHTAERVGARFEAVARQRLWMDGQARDARVYGLIPTDLG